jgi:NADH-quinone oxidoreductase E subunit
MAHLSESLAERARRVVALYPERRSALIPLCHLAQSQDGYLTEEAMEEIAELTGVTPAEVRGTASFYDMLHVEPVGRYVLAFCTNISCMLAGAYELLDHAEGILGTHVGQTTADGMFTIEDAECLADCDRAPCVQVNHRYVGALDRAGFDALVAELRAGGRDDIPPHGVLCRVDRSVGLPAAGADGAADPAGSADAAGAGMAGAGDPAGAPPSGTRRAGAAGVAGASAPGGAPGGAAATGGSGGAATGGSGGAATGGSGGAGGSVGAGSSGGTGSGSAAEGRTP